MQAADSMQERFNQWLEHTGFVLPQCPVSRTQNWMLVEDLAEFRQYQAGELVEGGSVFPAAMVICVDCGYTMFFNAGVAGLMKEE